MYNVLFVCTGNSARSILAEALLNRWGHGRFRAFSAGSHPAGYIHPMTLELLHKRKFPTKGLRSKSWHEFASPEAPHLNFVFILCDRAAAEPRPIWPGQPVTAHWHLEDPAAVHTSELRQRAFLQSFETLKARIKQLVIVPLTQVGKEQLQQRLDEIGR